jgi:hypothetical protein
MSMKAVLMTLIVLLAGCAAVATQPPTATLKAEDQAAVALVPSSPPVWKPGDEWVFRWESPRGKGTFAWTVNREEIIDGVEYYVVASGRQREMYWRKALSAMCSSPCTATFGLDVHTYCLMGTHDHMLCQMLCGNGAQEIFDARWINLQQRRVEDRCQRRYRTILVDHPVGLAPIGEVGIRSPTPICPIDLGGPPGRAS